MAKTKTAAGPKALGFNERELASFAAGGQALVQSNLELIQERLRDPKFEEKKDVYVRKAEQLLALSDLNLSETGVAIMQSIARSDLPFDDMVASLRKLDISLPLVKEEMYGARD